MWIPVMVDEIFTPQEGEEIKNILLARKVTEDSLYWSNRILVFEGR